MFYMVSNPDCDPPPVGDGTANKVPLCSRAVETHYTPLLGGPIPDPYLSTSAICRVLLDAAVAIPSSGSWFLQCMLAFWYTTANHKLLTKVFHCPFLMYWLPLQWNAEIIPSMPGFHNESQRCLNNSWSCILRNLCGNCMQTITNLE